MKIQIVKYLKAHKKARLREIGGALHVWHPKLLPDIYELMDAGIVVSETHNDPANMDSYILYSLREH